MILRCIILPVKPCGGDRGFLASSKRPDPITRHDATNRVNFIDDFCQPVLFNLACAEPLLEEADPQALIGNKAYEVDPLLDTLDQRETTVALR